MKKYSRIKNSLIGSIKKWITERNRRIALFVLAGALALVAGGIFAVQWQQGEAAAKNAQALLNESGFSASTGIAPAPGGTGTGNPNAQGTTGSLSSQLQGYTVISRLDIDKLDLSLPVLSETTDEALAVSACLYQGPQPGSAGNIVVTGHDYRSGAIFGKLSELMVGDSVKMTGTDGITYDYSVYEIDHIKPDNPQALDDTEYANELSLLTCENNGNGRLLIRCREIGT